jgi:hypothetical protein
MSTPSSWLRTSNLSQFSTFVQIRKAAGNNVVHGFLRRGIVVTTTRWAGEKTRLALHAASHHGAKQSKMLA